MKLIKCYMNQSTWLKNETDKITPRGVLWHSTGANNPYLARYVQPNDNASNKSELKKIIGTNSYGNDWNHIYVEAGVSFWIGKLDDDSIATIQAGPDNLTQWGCGGALNNTHIQFEICEDGLNNKTYFNAVYKEAIELTAYICKKYNLNPLGTFKYNGKTVPVITDHAGSNKLGMGSNHGDVGHWFKKYLGSNYLDKIRNDVYAEMNKGNNEPAKPTTPTTNKKYPATPFAVKVIIDDLNYRSEPSLSATVKGQTGKGTFTIIEVKDDWGKLKSGAGWIYLANPEYCTIKETVKSTTTSTKKPTQPTLKVGDKVKMKEGTPVYGGTAKYQSWVYNSTLYVREISGNRIVISTQKTGAVTGPVDKKYLTKI